MGLDMYARTAPAGSIKKEVDFFEPDGTEEFHYWRKHNALHGWMGQLYAAKGGVDSQFNCSNLQLNGEDLDALQDALEHKTLPVTGGFFFGSDSSEDAGRTEDDLVFVAMARLALQQGKQVYYTSWW